MVRIPKAAFLRWLEVGEDAVQGLRDEAHPIRRQVGVGDDSGRVVVRGGACGLGSDEGVALLMYGSIGGGLPPGVCEWHIPGNRPEDEFSELVVEELEYELRRAIRDGEVSEWTTLDDIWADLEEVEAELAGERVSPGQIAEEAMRRYIERMESEDEGEEVA